ncbi:MAG: hypothetical protein DMG34_20550 [Acidobacteria bacterium]|nr:MAG: hypothetical protein DMG34_20550 [Acidobacteriota bacterium]
MKKPATPLGERSALWSRSLRRAFLHVLKLVLLDGLRPAFFGLAFGIAGSIAAAQLIRSMLYGTGTLDPAVFLTVIAILLLVAAIACLIPAWRASRLDPMVALRTE